MKKEKKEPLADALVFLAEADCYPGMKLDSVHDMKRGMKRNRDKNEIRKTKR